MCPVAILFNPHNSPVRYYYHSQFPEEETEAQSGGVDCSQSCSSTVAEIGFRLKAFGWEPTSLPPDQTWGTVPISQMCPKQAQK